jgi:uncharacterized protein (TIGR00730 family)
VLKSLCVYCGSSLGRDPHYRAAAAQVGGELARRGLTLVYGAGRTGMMGTVADAALAGGATVVGVIPQGLVDLELAHTALPDLRVVDSMHERKALMASLADAFLALPGGVGTLEELAEILTWKQLELHRKPVGLYNHQGYYNALVAFLDHAVGQGFLQPTDRQLLLVDDDPLRLLDRLAAACAAADRAPAGP